jgi:hypothetical protein
MFCQLNREDGLGIGEQYMNELKLQRQIEDIKKEVDATGEIAEKRAVDLRADIDSLKLEIIALKEFLKSEFPAFEKRFSEIFKDTVNKVSPE